MSSKIFTVIKSSIEGEISFKGFSITRSTEYSTFLSIEEYGRRINPINFSACLSANVSSAATHVEGKMSRRIAGELVG